MEHRKKTLGITCISDTHHRHKKVDFSHVNVSKDILLHSGDLTNKGELKDVHDFCKWGNKLDFKYKICIAGNHDFCFEDYRRDSAEGMLKENGWIYLNNTSVVIEGIKIYGSPYQPWFYNWAFNLRGAERLKACWDLIPEDTNILLTHGPSHGILDYTLTGVHAGCQELYERLKTLQNSMELSHHIFGHIHEGYGRFYGDQITFINASILNEEYEVTNLPQCFEYSND